MARESTTVVFLRIAVAGGARLDASRFDGEARSRCPGEAPPAFPSTHCTHALECASQVIRHRKARARLKLRLRGKTRPRVTPRMLVPNPWGPYYRCPMSESNGK